MSDVKIRPIYLHDQETGNEDIWYEVRFKGIKTDGYTITQALNNLDTIMRNMLRAGQNPFLKSSGLA